MFGFDVRRERHLESLNVHISWVLVFITQQIEGMQMHLLEMYQVEIVWMELNWMAMDSDGENWKGMIWMGPSAFTPRRFISKDQDRRSTAWSE
jgi:hypothetical protein